jgi:translocation and assembly module TamB
VTSTGSQAIFSNVIGHKFLFLSPGTIIMTEQSKPKKILWKIAKIFGWIFLSIILLLIVIALAIQLPPVQNKLVQKAVTFLEEKIGTNVELEHISISFPKAIVLEGLYLEDQKKDTLLFAGKFSVDTDLWALARREIQLNDITLENCRAYISRPEKDSAYNFSYILKAFAGDSTATRDTLEQKGWQFSVEEITLEDIRARYHDYLTGNLMDLSLGELEVSISEFDLDKMKIVVDEINLSDTRTSFIQTKQPEVTEEVAEEKQPINYDIGVAHITLENIHASFEQQALGKTIRLDLDRSELETDKIDLKKNRIDLDRFSLSNTFLSVLQRKPPSQAPAKQYDPEPVAEKAAEESKPWIIALNELDLQGNSIQLYDYTKPHTQNALDFDHLWLTAFTMKAEDFLLNGSDIKVDLRNLSFREKSGFTIGKMTAAIDVTDKKMDLNNLLILTGNSRIEADARATFPSLKTIATTYAQAKFKVDVNRTSLSLRDVLYFKPSLADSLPLAIAKNSKIYVDAALSGSVPNLNIAHVTVDAFKDTHVKASGTIKGLPDAKKMYMDLAVDKFHTTKTDLDFILADSTIPTSIALPDWLDLSAKYQGTLEKSTFKTLLTTSIGNVTANGAIDLDSTSVTRGYKGELTVDALDLGYLLIKPDTLGKLNLHSTFDVTGLSKEEMNGKVNAVVTDFEYMKYRYQDFKLDATIKDGFYDGLATMHDPNLEFSLEGDLDYSRDVPKYHLTFDMKNANFKALNLSERPLKARGVLLTDIATDDFRKLNGTLGLRKVAIYNGDAVYAVDSLLFASIDQEGKSELKIDSDLMSGYFEGSFNIFSIGDVLKEYISTYYSLRDSAGVARKDPARQHFKFSLKLKKTELLTEILLPQLEKFVPGEIKGEFDSEAKKLDMRIDIDEVQYSKVGVKSFLLRTNSDQEKLNYNMIVDEIKVDSMRIDGLEFNGTIADNKIVTDLIILDSLDKHKYFLGGIFTSLEKGFQFAFRPDKVKLNYVDWKVPADNYIRFGGAKVIAKDIELVNGRERIIIDSRDDAASTLFVGFRELNLEYLVSMASKEKAVSGLLHGDIFIVPDTANMTFTANLGINDFNLSGIPWGDITLRVGRESANRFDVDFAVISDRNNLKATGFYVTGDHPDMALKAYIRKFDLKTIEPLTGGQLKDMNGLFTGELAIKGSPRKPKVNGELNFDDVAFFSTYLNTPFSLDNETIAINDRGIVFDNFDLLDNRKNKATIDGAIETKDFSAFRFNIDLVTNNFRLLNTTEKDNELFYGKVDMNATIKVRGSMQEPSVTMQVGLGQDSHLTYVVPQAEAGIMEQEGIVRFVDNTFKNDPFMKRIDQADTMRSRFLGLNLSARIELTDKEKFTVIIDPTTGDQLTVRGNTTLTLSMNPSGDMDLSGRYEISEGTYNLSFYKFVKREFKIEKGSTMTWTGDPLNARMDMSAMYKVETAPIDLLSAQLTGADQTEVNRFKQRLPFMVYLNIKGELLKPEIDFRLDMPMADRNYGGGIVYSRLQDINTRESDLNKQVFALLLLKRFISDNPLESQGASSMEGTARTSVSKLLTEQLNRLSQNVRGVELSFDVKSYEDYSSGKAQGSTQLQLGLSKNLFNDRLVVKVAGNVGIEGEDTGNEVTDYIGDLALEYKLTEDGRFRITGFRNSNYDMIDGELTETGAGLIYVKDYDLLSELFKANAKDKKK